MSGVWEQTFPSIQLGSQPLISQNYSQVEHKTQKVDLKSQDWLWCRAKYYYVYRKQHLKKRILFLIQQVKNVYVFCKKTQVCFQTLAFTLSPLPTFMEEGGRNVNFGGLRRKHRHTCAYNIQIHIPHHVHTCSVNLVPFFPTLPTPYKEKVV